MRPDQLQGRPTPNPKGLYTVLAFLFVYRRQRDIDARVATGSILGFFRLK